MTSEVPNHFFWADLHIDSPRLCNEKGRPFSSIEAWRDYSVEKINQKVTKNDILWFLGDLAYKNPQTYRSRLICKNQRLIIGNHDSPVTIKSFGKFAWHSRTVKIDGIKFYLNHYPNAFWDCSHYGSVHLYGHTHSQREDTLDSIFPNRRSIDVSPENHFRVFGTWDIFSFNEIMDYMKNRSGHDEIKFYHDYQERIFSTWKTIK